MNVDERVPRSHLLRKLRILVDGVLANLDAAFETVYACGGRPTIPPAHLLRGSLIQILDTVRSERQRVEQLDSIFCFAESSGCALTMGCGITRQSARTAIASLTRAWRASRLRASRLAVRIAGSGLG